MDLLVAQVRELYGRVVYSHKAHEKASDLALVHLAALKRWQIYLSSLTTGSLLTSLLGAVQAATVVAAVIATIQLIVNSYLKNYDLGAIAQKHADAAGKLWEVRESYLSLLTDLQSNAVDAADARKKRDKLQEQLAAIYKGSPRTDSKSYGAAQRALKQNEELTFSDHEIDLFLPVRLRTSTSTDSVPSSPEEANGITGQQGERGSSE